ncbi:MAG: CHAD domain-containing protein [Myxococcaceae bacterium]
MAPVSAERWLQHLRDYLPVAREAVDPEGPHQLRVSIGRLRVWLRLGGWRVLDDDLRWLRGEIGPVRDLDVELQHEPPARWAARLRRQRGQAERTMFHALDDQRLEGLLQALGLMPPVPRRQARRALSRLAEAALKRGTQARGEGKDVAALHRLRCAVRRLRYALEWLDEDADELVRLQDALGTACDRFIALRRLEEQRAVGHFRRYHAQLAHELHEAVQDARAAWKLARPGMEVLRCSNCT